MQFLHSTIGSAADNQKSPIHNWYKFTAGFSYRFVEEVIKQECLTNNNHTKIFDPFAGCGTTLVSSQKLGVSAIGNEGQKFMFDIIRAKLNWLINEEQALIYKNNIKHILTEENHLNLLENTIHPLLATLYADNTLKTLYLIKHAIQAIESEEYQLFFKLALSQTLHKVCIHPIAIPYIVRSKKLTNTHSAWDVFERILDRMLYELKPLKTSELTSKVFLHDSRKENKHILDEECSTCITSPPYLNNLDYGEVSKVHTHFFNITSNWNDITVSVRHNLVTGSTTHYKESEFNIELYRASEFYLMNSCLAEELIDISVKLKAVGKNRNGKKSYDILTLLYFNDMYLVLKEIRRIIHKKGKAFLILGDSAPYGVFIATTKYLGQIGLNAGFNKYEVFNIRSRGSKWKSLKHRHALELTENVLVLQ